MNSFVSYVKSNNFVITILSNMELSVIRIGNSKGILLNKSILQRYNILDKVEVILEKGRIILKPVPNIRQGWEDAFREMHDKKEDIPLMPDIFEDEEEWN
jgi:antitoxin MazE